MHLNLPFPEAIQLALLGAPLPALVSHLTCADATIRADLALRAVPEPPFALRALAVVAPIVRVDAKFRAFDAGRATFDLAIRAGSVPVHRLLNQLTGLLNTALGEAHVPAGLVSVTHGPHGEPVAVLDLQSAVAVRADGVTLTGFAIHDGAIQVGAAVRGFALRSR